MNASIYKLECDGYLHYVASGNISVTSPQVVNKNGSKMKPYISLNFGKYRIHLDKEQFKKIYHTIEGQ